MTLLHCRQLVSTHRVPEARALCLKLSHAQPDNPEVWFLLGAIQGLLGEFEAARQSCCRAIALRPDLVDAHYNLAQACMHLHQIESAVSAYSDVLRLAPDHFEAGNGLAMALKEQARVEEAVAMLRKVVRRSPWHAGACSNLLYFQNYLATDPQTLYAEHRAWGDALQNHIGSSAKGTHAPDAGRRLRVGYLSPDFRTHSVAYFLYPLLSHNDPHQVDVFCYANVARPDTFTTRFRALAVTWRDISRMTDDNVYQCMRGDAIDILVDLAGHTAGNRLAVFARRPAPVQFSFLGYPNTTGLAAIDYRFTDAAADPPGETDSWHVEQLVRLPEGFLCYQPPDGAPEISPCPARRAGRITFGSFNNLAKLAPAVVELWSRVLQAVPESRLALKCRSFFDPATRDRVGAAFAQHGIEGARLVFEECTVSIDDHLASYGAVDIALDPFPYNGTTTTCEALWMGVPVVSLAGAVHAARVGLSILTRVGLEDLVATDPESYVRIAVELAQDETRRAALREGLRARMAASPLCDAPAYAREVERAYRSVWRAWCAKQ